MIKEERICCIVTLACINDCYQDSHYYGRGIWAWLANRNKSRESEPVVSSFTSRILHQILKSSFIDNNHLGKNGDSVAEMRKLSFS